MEVHKGSFIASFGRGAEWLSTWGGWGVGGYKACSADGLLSPSKDRAVGLDVPLLEREQADCTYLCHLSGVGYIDHLQ